MHLPGFLIRSLCLALFAFSVAMLASHAHAQGHVPLSNVNVFPNTGSQSETTIAINPTDSNNIIVAANRPGAGAPAITGARALFFSTDGGATWSQPATALSFTTDKGNTFTSSSDPWVDFDGSGNAYCAYLLFNRDSQANPTIGALVVAKSTDKGNTWGTPVAIVDHSGESVSTVSFEDHESIAIDKSSGVIYVAWTHFKGRIPLTDLAPGDEIHLSYSTDGGATFAAPIPLQGPNQAQFAVAAVAINGDLYVTWADFVQSNIIIARFIRTAGGPPGAPPVSPALPPRIVGSFTLPWSPRLSIPAQPDRGLTAMPVIACDSRDAATVYVAWPDRGGNGGSDTDINISKSTNFGLDWSGRRRVNNDAPSSNASQFNCAMAIDPDDNSLNISYYDTRRDPTNRRTDYFLSRSTDGGSTFAETRVTTAQSDESVNNAARNLNNYGDYSGIAARGGFVFPVWADSRGVGERFPLTTSENVYVARVGTCGSGLTFKVTTTADAVAGSLRQALAQAGACGRIEFNVPTSDTGFSAGYFAFAPLGDLPPVSADNITIDGNSEDTFLHTNPNPTKGPSIVIRGNSPTASSALSDGIVVSTNANDTSLVRLGIAGFPGNGILVGGNHTTISNCWIGLNGDGLALANQIGINISKGANKTQVSGNVISGNSFRGMQIDSDDNQISLNRIGVNPDATQALKNGSDGILLNGSKNVIGKDGDKPGGLNIISGNGGNGIVIRGSENLVGTNRIGTHENAAQAIPNSGHGISIVGGTSNIIGSPKAGGGGSNTISGNQGSGISLTAKARLNRIAGNLIGTNGSGSAALPNGFDGVSISDGSVQNEVDGSGPQIINLISGNIRDGISISGVGTDRNQVIETFIGTELSGKGSIANQGNGVHISGRASTNTIGQSNIIATNLGDGVRIEVDFAARNAIRRNSITNNGGLGINLVGGTEDALGVTANDARDLDEGANRLQNYPMLVSFRRNGSTVDATLNSLPNKTYTVEVFANQNVAPNRPAEGEIFVTQVDVSTDSNGNSSFHFTVPQGSIFGLPLTATATDADGNTSEFSNVVYSNVSRASFGNRMLSAITNVVNTVLRFLGIKKP